MKDGFVASLAAQLAATRYRLNPTGHTKTEDWSKSVDFRSVARQSVLFIRYSESRAFQPLPRDVGRSSHKQVEQLIKVDNSIVKDG